MKYLQRDLEDLEKTLLDLAGRVEEAVRKSITALIERRTCLAREVIEGDGPIDQCEVALEEDCLKILALHQPVASDLRFVVTCLKIDNDLERIADLAASIGERVLSLAAQPPQPVPHEVGEMLELSARMLRESLDAFVRGDADAARRVCELDDQVDAHNRRVIERVLQDMHTDPGSIGARMDLISISKSLERIADHTTNIAEDVIYMVEGEIVRHRLAL